MVGAIGTVGPSRIAGRRMVGIQPNLDVGGINGVGELDEVELHTQDDYSICNKLIIKEETYNLEFDDSGLESNLFIIWTDGNYGYEIVYQNSPPAFNGEWK